MHKSNSAVGPVSTWPFEFVPICEHPQFLPRKTAGILCPTLMQTHVSEGLL